MTFPVIAEQIPDRKCSTSGDPRNEISVDVLKIVDIIEKGKLVIPIKQRGQKKKKSGVGK